MKPVVKNFFGGLLAGVTLIILLPILIIYFFVTLLKHKKCEKVGHIWIPCKCKRCGTQGNHEWSEPIIGNTDAYVEWYSDYCQVDKELVCSFHEGEVTYHECINCGFKQEM